MFLKTPTVRFMNGKRTQGQENHTGLIFSMLQKYRLEIRQRELDVMAIWIIKTEQRAYIGSCDLITQFTRLCDISGSCFAAVPVTNCMLFSLYWNRMLSAAFFLVCLFVAIEQFLYAFYNAVHSGVSFYWLGVNDVF